MNEWWVDPESGSLTNNGTSPESPWRIIPGQTGANLQTGYSVSPGDTINVRNGTVSTQRLVIPFDNLTYRGYGTAHNKLKLKLPTRGGAEKYETTVVRETGVHEGMWVLYGPSATDSGFLTYFTRSGCAVEDCHVIAPNCPTAISLGPSSSAAVGATLRRSRVSGAAGSGAVAYTRGLLIEDVAFEDIGEDGILLGATAANGFRANTRDVIRRICIERVGTDEVSGVGDAIQTLASSDRFESSLHISQIYVYKPSAVKQAFVFADVLGGLVLEDFLVESSDEGQAQILFNGVGSTAIVRCGTIIGGCANNAAVRLSGTQGIETGSLLLVTGIVVRAPRNAGLFTIGGSESACTVNGRIVIANNSIDGQNEQNLSFSAGISIHPGALVTLGASASLLAVNNIINCKGRPAVRLPVGAANDSRWEIRSNQSENGTFGAIGATSYATPADFEAAHAPAQGNMALPEGGYTAGLPVPTSLAAAGAYVQGVRLQNGRMRPGYCPVGAYQAVLPRGTRA